MTLARLRAPRVVVLGGGSVGKRAVRQLFRAFRAGRLSCDAVVVVDRDPDCEVGEGALALTSAGGPPLRIEVAGWAEWLEARLPTLDLADQLVLHHWGPNLLAGWMASEVARAGGTWERVGPVRSRPWPFEAVTPAGDRALSYATWTCPPLCIEPARCPHTRGARDWSLVGDLARPPADADASIVFPSLHLVWGIGAVPVRAVLEARDRVVGAMREGPRTYATGTASHCHGVAALVRIALC